MKRIWSLIGVIAYWLSWPALFVYLRLSKRTRVLIMAQGKMLVVKGWLGNGRWTLPGGGVHRKEDVELAAVREVYEETGILLDAKQLTYMYDALFTEHGLRFKYICYKVELRDKVAIKSSKEITDAIWVDPHELRPGKARQDVLEALSRMSA